MKSMLRIAPMVLAAAAALHSSDAVSADAALLGCWKSESITQTLANGTTGTSPPSACVIRFYEDRIQFGCPGASNVVNIEYTYRVVKPGVYWAKMTAHNRLPDLVGSEREYDYKVDKSFLFITTYPQTTKPAPPTAAVRVESKSVKVPCPDKLD